MGQQRNGHDRLPEAHLICQDTIQAPLVQGQHPVEAYVLVLPQGMLEQERDLEDNVMTVSSPVCTTGLPNTRTRTRTRTLYILIVSALSAQHATIGVTSGGVANSWPHAPTTVTGKGSLCMQCVARCRVAAHRQVLTQVDGFLQERRLIVAKRCRADPVDR